MDSLKRELEVPYPNSENNDFRNRRQFLISKSFLIIRHNDFIPNIVFFENSIALVGIEHEILSIIDLVIGFCKNTVKIPTKYFHCFTEKVLVQLC